MVIDVTKPEMYQHKNGSDVIAFYKEPFGAFLTVLKAKDDSYYSLLIYEYSMDNLILKQVKKPWSDLKDGDPCMVSEDGEEWFKRYFSGKIASAIPTVYAYGRTKWTGIFEHEKWKFCRPPTEEELKS